MIILIIIYFCRTASCLLKKWLSNVASFEFSSILNVRVTTLYSKYSKKKGLW